MQRHGTNPCNLLLTFCKTSWYHCLALPVIIQNRVPWKLMYERGDMKPSVEPRGNTLLGQELRRCHFILTFLLETYVSSVLIVLVMVSNANVNLLRICQHVCCLTFEFLVSRILGLKSVLGELAVRRHKSASAHRVCTPCHTRCSSVAHDALCNLQQWYSENFAALCQALYCLHLNDRSASQCLRPLYLHETAVVLC